MENNISYTANPQDKVGEITWTEFRQLKGLVDSILVYPVPAAEQVFVAMEIDKALERIFTEGKETGKIFPKDPEPQPDIKAELMKP